MKTNSLLTYLLYALLATLILAAGYKACEMQREKQEKAKAQADWEETLRKIYPEGDSTAASGSSYTSRDSALQSSGTTTNKDGIEGEIPPKSNTSTTTQNPATSTTTTATPPKEASKPKASTSNPAVKGVGKGRYAVRAGTFSQMENARDRLEEVIKMGYTNAEIGKTNGGKYAIVVVLRTNDKAKAIQTADQLEKRGIDAAVFDQNRKN